MSRCVAQSLCDDFGFGAFNSTSLADLNDEIRPRIEAASPTSCTQAEIAQCVAADLAAFGLGANSFDGDL